MAYFKLNNLSEEERKKYYDKLENKIENDAESQRQRAIEINQEATRQKEASMPQQRDNNISQPKKKITVPQRGSLYNTQGALYNTNKPMTSKDIRRTARDTQIFNTSNTSSLWDRIKGIADKTGYVGSNFVSGAFSGTTGIAQGQLTEIASNLQKGSNMDNIEVGKTALSLLFPNSIGLMMKANDYNKKAMETLRDNNKTGWEKASEIALSGVQNAKEGADLYNIADVERIAGKALPEADKKVLEVNEKIGKPAKDYRESLQEKSKDYDGVTNFIASGMQSVGNMVPSMVASAVTKDPTASLAVMGASVKGQATQEALEKGEDLETATRIGDAKALIEVATEKLSGGAKIFGKGNLDDLADELVKKGAKSKVGRFLLTQVTNAGGEIAEEELSNVLGNVIDKGTTDPDKKIIDTKEALETMGSTAFTTTMLNLLTGGMVNDYRQIGNEMNQYRDSQTGEVLDNNSQNALHQAENIINQSNTEPQQSTQSGQNLSTQQITQEPNNIAQNGNMEQIKIDSENFSKQVENVKNIAENNDLVVLSKTPQIYKDLGANDLPMTVTKNHTIWAMTPKSEENSHFHGISKETLKQLPEAMTRPLNIVQSGSDSNSIVAITELVDEDGALVIVPIKINKGKANVNEIEIDANVFKSIYGKDNDYDTWMKNNIKKGRMLYDIDEGIIKKYRDNPPRLQLSNDIIPTDETSSFINNSIPQNETNVKSNTDINNKFMQNNENNTQNAPTKGETIGWNEISRTNTELKGDTNTEEKVAKILKEPIEKVKEKNRTWAILKANLIDKNIVFEELSRKTNNRDLQGKADYMLSSEARGQYAIGNERYDGEKRISKSLTDIIDEVGENAGDFYSYMYHQLNVDRMTLEERYGGDTGINYERNGNVKNKPVFGEGITAQISRDEVTRLEKKYPEFKKYAQDVYDYLDANKKELVDKGVISQETSDLFKEMYPHYVPIQRVGRNENSISVPLDTGRTGVNSPIKRAKGGSSDIAPLFETMADKTLQTYRASARNNFGVELKNTLSKLNQLNQTSDIADIDTIMDNITDEQQNSELLQEGKNGNNPTFTVFENGERVTFDISQDMYEALKPRDRSSILSKTFKIPNKLSSFHRGVLTEYNPIFSITNAIKDAQDVLLNSQHSARTYAKFPEAYAQIIGKGHWYQEYIQNGGEQNSYFKDGQFDKPKTNLPTKTKNAVTFPLREISSINNVIEMSPRLAEYIASREKGASIETAMLDASRVTTNFKAGGDVTKFANRNGATFLNASVQGFQQQVRNIQEANAKGLKGYAVLATKYAIAGVPALILNGLIWKDDDDYEKLQDYVKDNYYCVGKLPNGEFIRIPKGRVSATIQKIISNANDFIKDGKIISDDVGKEFWNDLKEDFKFAIDNVAPNNPIDNNILAPIVQVTQNKTWYGEDLVPSRLKNLPTGEQFDESTDKLSKWLGENIGFSPYKINYLLNQYSGGVGDVLLPMGTPQAENNVIEDKFTANPILKNKYPGKFFEKIEELNVSNNSSKANDTDKIKYKYASEVQKSMSELYKQEREVQNSSDTDEVKKKKILDIQKKINKMAEDELKNIEKINVTGNTAKVNNTEYYKATNLKDGTQEWKEITDEEKEKKKNISLNTYVSYKEAIAKETIKQRKAGNIKEEGQLSDKSKIDILLSSKYSDEDKANLYENLIMTKPKENSLDTYKVIKSSNMNINEYLKYKQQEFVSDKEDDGTLNGKSVSSNDEGSKKNKFINYINSMKITGEQRILLYAMQGYKTTSSQKKQLVNYVQNLDLDKDTKLKLYNRFSGFKSYKDGTVKY